MYPTCYQWWSTCTVYLFKVILYVHHLYLNTLLSTGMASLPFSTVFQVYQSHQGVGVFSSVGWHPAKEASSFPVSSLYSHQLVDNRNHIYVCTCIVWAYLGLCPLRCGGIFCAQQVTALTCSQYWSFSMLVSVGRSYFSVCMHGAVHLAVRFF